MIKKNYFEDIIFAKATPSGQSAIAVIRVSGKDSWSLISDIFKFSSDKIKLRSHKVYYGKIIDKSDVIDNALIITFAENKSFTGEESFEIHSHGSEIIISLIGKKLLSLGARHALPGEFSKRAFLNGKIDLAEAEAIMDVVNASTAKSVFIAERQLSGVLSNEINSIKSKITDLLAEIEVNIDYPEEDLSYELLEWHTKIEKVLKKLDELLKDFNRGHFYREGINAVIMGRTNSGKSTLFNFLLNEEKAIVSDIHGTTRDFLDGVINISGYGVRLFDTAGLRESFDPIEKEGTKRALTLSGTSDIVLYLISADTGLDEKDITNFTKIKCKKLLVVINKTDLIGKSDLDKLENDIKKHLQNEFNELKIVGMSALKKTGLDIFNSAFISFFENESITESGDPILTNARHAGLIEKSSESIKDALIKIDNEALDLAAFELRESLNKLGEITGEVTTDDILEKIFSTFCVGK
jgi:tRNA modification GTPase